MKALGANISYKVSGYLGESLKKMASFEMANHEMYSAFGISHFFDNDEEFQTLKNDVSDIHHAVEEPDRAEYGDFQTSLGLAGRVTAYLASKNVSPEILIEPTCGKGHFIVAALRNLTNIEKIYGVEIYMPYIWETKFNIIHYFLENPDNGKPEIIIKHDNVFGFDFREVAKRHRGKEVLVIGNPPWVTNSKLGSLNSGNLPAKTNFKNHSGIDAITGKGNFDIAENITLAMIEAFQKMNGNLVLLVKNSVIKNIIFGQYANKYAISKIQKHCIDSKKEFNVSVDAALFCCTFNSEPELECQEFDFYNNQNPYLKFGWEGKYFVSDIEAYACSWEMDGECPFIWRQGLKHDCAQIMELDKVNGHYVNGQNEETQLEDGLVYGFLKSSDLKNTVIAHTRKFTIVTQKKVGQDTRYIKNEYPQTYRYLSERLQSFEARKSSIYRNKPPFSIFGIGDYSFKPYKVAISGLYKTFHFTLVLPQDNKPVMLDDTCYLIGFDKIEFAVYALILLNSEKTTRFLQSITFADAKRTFTKDVLMRIDLLTIAQNTNHADLQKDLDRLNKKYGFLLTLDLWDAFMTEMIPVKNGQMAMFE